MWDSNMEREIKRRTVCRGREENVWRAEGESDGSAKAPRGEAAGGEERRERKESVWRTVGRGRRKRAIEEETVERRRPMEGREQSNPGRAKSPRGAAAKQANALGGAERTWESSERGVGRAAGGEGKRLSHGVRDAKTTA